MKRPPAFPFTHTVGCLLWLGLPFSANAVEQADPADSARVVGTVTDGLSGAPLDRATVVLMPLDWMTSTDEAGAFEFDGLPGGEYDLTFLHPDVPNWIANPLSRRISVAPGSASDVALSTPTAEALLSQYCPGGSQRLAAVRVRDLLTTAPMPGAGITIRSGRTADDLASPSLSRADTWGEYRFCIDSAQAGLSLQARIGDVTSRVRTLELAGPVVQVDLFLRNTLPSRIEGIVREEGTLARIAGVTISLAGSRLRSATDADGGFTISGVPPGQTTLVAEHLAYGRAEGEILVGVRDTVTVEVLLSPSAIELAPLAVEVRSSTASRRDRMTTRFDGLSRQQIDALLPRVTDFAGLLQNANVPGLRVQRVSFVDERTGVLSPGICIEVSRRQSRFARVCEGMVVVYINGSRVSSPEDVLQGLIPSAIDDIRLLSPLEAGAQYGGGAGGRNGVLLITTR